jgi:hypothetical protein
MGDPIKNIYFIESTRSLEAHTIFPEDMEYDDEYYKSTYLPTIEEQEQLDKLLAEENEHNN